MTQPETPQLSPTLAETIRWLNQNETLTPEQLKWVLGFLPRHMPHLHVFALDMEFAASCKGPLALSHAATAGARLYKRLTDVAAPVVAVRIPAGEIATSLPPIDLTPYRRGSLGGAA